MIALVALVFKTTLLSVVQVLARLKARTFLVPEDARLVRLALSDHEAPFVVCCGAVWRNDLEIIPFFLITALSFSVLGGTASTAGWMFASFVIVRYLYTAIYLMGPQPWRAAAFLTGLSLTWVLIILSLKLAFEGGASLASPRLDTHVRVIRAEMLLAKAGRSPLRSCEIGAPGSMVSFHV